MGRSLEALAAGGGLFPAEQNGLRTCGGTGGRCEVAPVLVLRAPPRRPVGCLSRTPTLGFLLMCEEGRKQGGVRPGRKWVSGRRAGGGTRPRSRAQLRRSLAPRKVGRSWRWGAGPGRGGCSPELPDLGKVHGRGHPGATPRAHACL